MKAIKIVTLSLLFLTFSCSKSSDDEVKNEENSIIGYWVLKDLISLEDDSEAFFSQSQDFKTALPHVNCNIISFEFRADNVMILDSNEFDERLGEEDPKNPVYECFDLDSISGTWRLDGNIITLTTSEGSGTLTIRFQDGRLYVDAGDTLGELGALAQEFIFEKLGEA